MTNEEIKTLYFIGNNEPTVMLTHFDWEVVNYFLDVSGNIKGGLDKGNPEYFDDIKTNLNDCTIYLHKLEDALKVIFKKGNESALLFWSLCDSPEDAKELLKREISKPFLKRIQVVNTVLVKNNICWTNEEVEGVKLIEL